MVQKLRQEGVLKDAPTCVEKSSIYPHFVIIDVCSAVNAGRSMHHPWACMQDVLCNSSDFYYHIQGVSFCNSNKLSDAYGFSLGSNAMEITAFVHCGRVNFKNLSCSSHCVISIMKSTSCCRYVWSSHAVSGLSYYLVMPVWSRFKSAITFFLHSLVCWREKNICTIRVVIVVAAFWCFLLIQLERKTVASFFFDMEKL
jgi:hypothetical protein